MTRDYDVMSWNYGISDETKGLLMDYDVMKVETIFFLDLASQAKIAISQCEQIKIADISDLIGWIVVKCI